MSSSRSFVHDSRSVNPKTLSKNPTIRLRPASSRTSRDTENPTWLKVGRGNSSAVIVCLQVKKLVVSALSSHQKAAIDLEHGSIDVVVRRRCQESDSGSYVVGLSHVAQRQVHLLVALCHLGLGGPWCDPVAEDVVLLTRHCERDHEPVNRRLGSNVRGTCCGWRMCCS